MGLRQTHISNQQVEEQFLALTALVWKYGELDIYNLLDQLTFNLQKKKNTES